MTRADQGSGLRRRRRRSWPVAAAAASGVCAAVALHATCVAPYRPRLRRRMLEVPASWPALEILHLTDMQLRRSDPKLLRVQAQALAQLGRQPDLVCVTGDVCERVGDAPLVAELLRCLAPRLGTYVILGNHEYGAGRPAPLGGPMAPLGRLLRALYGADLSSGPLEGDATAGALERLGVRVLRNEGLRLSIGDRSLWLAGVDDGWAHRADVRAAMRGRRADEGVLALVHEPELAFPCVDRGADLVLAGHTHGGQVCLPLVGPLYTHRLDTRLTIAAGVQRIGRAQLHISAGLGQLLPVRFLCPPELVWLTCVPRVA